MSIIVREVRSEDARTFWEVHHASVRGIASADYPPEVVNDWAPPITERWIRRFLLNRDREIRFVGELDGEIVGIGVLVPERCEVRGCYVAPRKARKGIGTAIMREIERRARELELPSLELDSSMNAEPFYAALG